METQAQSFKQSNDILIRKEWFSEIISTLAADEVAIEADVAPEEKKNFYDSLIFKSGIELAKQTSFYLHQSVTAEIVHAYLKELREIESKLLKIAFDISGQEILVWAEINDDDWKTEKALYLIAAKINSLHMDSQYSISTTIIEKSEDIKVPTHYYKLEK